MDEMKYAWMGILRSSDPGHIHSSGGGEWDRCEGEFSGVIGLGNQSKRSD